METCEYCHEVEKGAGHWCTPLKDFIGDPTMGSLLWEEEFGEPAPKELP